jgi:N-acyl-D-aspartate/D-glutamate deacylase
MRVTAPMIPPSAYPQVDLALIGGRVLDPETGLNVVADVGISAGRIVSVGAVSGGLQRIDCTGLVVCPGFVDLHSHAQNLSGARLQVLDGVTTALDLECGMLATPGWYERIAEEGRPLNYGYSASWALARAHVVGGGELPSTNRFDTGFAAFQALAGDSFLRREISERQRERVLEVLREAVHAGALGIGAMLGYLPHSDPAELADLTELSTRLRSAVFVHSRSSARTGPVTALDAVEELVSKAERTGAHVHLCHVNSTSSSWLPQILDTISAARERGVRLSTETYPYARGSTVIGASFLSAPELAREGRRPDSLTYLATGEDIADSTRLEQLRHEDPSGLVLTTTYDKADPKESALFDLALTIPHAAFASDAMPTTPPVEPANLWPLPASSYAHPRSAGCFSRVLRSTVRERGLLSLPEAVRRCTLVPADLLADVAPAMRWKGRLQPGADADVIAFDPAAAADNATYAELRASVGMRHVLVGGTVVVREGRLVPDARPGRRINGAKDQTGMRPAPGIAAERIPN